MQESHPNRYCAHDNIADCKYIYVGRLRYAGTIAYASGESKYRNVAVPRIIIADIEYVMDASL